MFSDIITFFKTLSQGLPSEGNLFPDSLRSLLSPLEDILGNLNTGAKIAGIVLSLIVALLFCFLGYKLSRVFMSLTGFFAGAILGFLIAAYVIKKGFYIDVLCVVAGGLIFAFLAYWIYMAGLFILCFFLAFIASSTIIRLTGDFAFFFYTLISLAVGCLALKYIRPVIIFLSSIVGGAASAGFIVALGSYLHFSIFESMPPKIILAVVLSLLGILVQMLTTKDPGKKKKPKHNKKKRKKQNKESE